MIVLDEVENKECDSCGRGAFIEVALIDQSRQRAVYSYLCADCASLLADMIKNEVES